jgi:hypothetical protein
MTTTIDWKETAFKHALTIVDKTNTITSRNKEIAFKNAEIDRLKRIMPHIGGTCKWNYATFKCKANEDTLCDAPCINGEWELKE